MLVPFEDLRPRSEPPGAGAADRREDAQVERDARDRPSLPFSGFSLLALVLSGVAATSAGRRLQVATDGPADAAADPDAASPLRAPTAEPARAQAPAHATNRRPLLLAAGLLAVAALATARAR
ncbi:MAG TPA: hypothetical protein VF715_16675 [Thermoleophilaceae bacterium]